MAINETLAERMIRLNPILNNLADVNIEWSLNCGDEEGVMVEMYIPVTMFNKLYEFAEDVDENG